MTNELAMNWNLNTLNKAYQQGYMAGMLQMDQSKCPYRGEVVVAAWESGWEDGFNASESGSQNMDQVREQIA